MTESDADRRIASRFAAIADRKDDSDWHDVLRRAEDRGVPHPRRPPLRRVAIAAAPAAAIVTAVLLLAGDAIFPGAPPERALAITHDADPVTKEDSVRIRVVNAGADPDQMNAELREAGINACVETVPVTRDSVGDWLGVGASGGSPDGLPSEPPEPGSGDFPVGRFLETLADQIDEHPKFITVSIPLPRGVSRLELQVGRPAEPGEEPVSAEGPIWAGGPCFRPGFSNENSTP